ncbi:MAG: hypothetical protein DHS20C11_12470 [Lysobacteraceae bacterium]|nr:MAG: hypothetical protein DHS20C11_12470 [Xanthomonadaceae bacterium]
MKKITDDDLVLVYYGEHSDADLVRRVAEDPQLTNRLAVLSEQLSALDVAMEPPSRSSDYGAEVWQKLVPTLADQGPARKPWSSAWLKPTAAFASVLAAIGVAFILGRQTAPVADSISNPPQLASSVNSGRVLASYSASYLQQMDVLLTGLANQSAPADINTWAAEMLLKNRVVRVAAENAEQHRLAQLLRELEPLLIELSHETAVASPRVRQRLQTEAQDTWLLRVRVMQSELATQPNKTSGLSI